MRQTVKDFNLNPEARYDKIELEIMNLDTACPDLNTNERRVLVAIAEAINWETWCEFTCAGIAGYFTDLNRHEVAGYVSSLQEKDYIYCCTEYGQISMNEKGSEVFNEQFQY